MALMALVDRFMERRALERTFVENPAKWLVEMFGGRASSSGVTVTTTTAMQHSAVYACVRIIAETIGSLPLPVYKRTDDGSKTKAFEHPLYRVLHDQPNPEQTAMEWREMLQGHLTLRHNAYAEIERDNGGRVTALWPLHPDRMRVTRTPAGDLVYGYRPPLKGAEQELTAERVLHLRGLSDDGVMGLSPIALNSETIGTGLAQEEFDGRFFTNNATPPAVVEYPGNLNDEKVKELRASLYDQSGGLSRAHRFMLLQGGLKWTNVGMTLRDAQFIEGRKLSVRAIARIFRVPPHKIGDMEQATFSNIEHQAIEFVTDTIRPWAVRWDQALTTRLLTERERKAGYFIELNLDGLMRGDFLSRVSAYVSLRNAGLTTANRVAALENWEPFGPAGDIVLVPLNLIPADQVGQKPAPTTTPAVVDAPSDDPLKRHLLGEALGRIVHRETEAMRRAAAKFASKPDEWRGAVSEFYARHAAYIAETLGVEVARVHAYVQDHRARVLAEGVAAVDGWDAEARAHLAALASDGVPMPLAAAPAHPPVNVNVYPTTTIAEGALRVDVAPAAVTFPDGAIRVEAPVTIAAGAVQVDARSAVTVPPAPEAQAMTIEKTVTKRDAAGRPDAIRETHTPKR